MPSSLLSSRSSCTTPELLDLGVSERAITHRLALYLERELDHLGRNWKVDCKYNRKGRKPKELRELPPRRMKPRAQEFFPTSSSIVADSRGQPIASSSSK